MKNLIGRILVGIAILASSACTKTDNYPAPSSTITGSTIDEVTGATLQTEIGGGGTRVKLLETSYDSAPVPLYFQSERRYESRKSVEMLSCRCGIGYGRGDGTGNPLR